MIKVFLTKSTLDIQNLLTYLYWCCHTIQGDLKVTNNILRLPDVKINSGCSRSTLYLRIKQGLWTKPVKLGDRAVGWPASEVTAINTARIAGKSNDDIRNLVQELEKGRKLAFQGVQS